MQLQQYAYDKNLAEEGRRVPLGGDAFVVIAKFGNNKFQAMLRQKTAAFGRRADRIPFEEKESIYLQCFSRTIVLDWGGIKDGEKEIPYSPENVIEVCKKYPEFHADLLELSKETATFQIESMEEDLGNSETPSEPNSG